MTDNVGPMKCHAIHIPITQLVHKEEAHGLDIIWIRELPDGAITHKGVTAEAQGQNNN